MISIGAYQTGANALVDAALRLQEPIQAYLQQDRNAGASMAQAVERLTELKRLREGWPVPSVGHPVANALNHNEETSRERSAAEGLTLTNAE